MIMLENNSVEIKIIVITSLGLVCCVLQPTSATLPALNGRENVSSIEFSFCSSLSTRDNSSSISLQQLVQGRGRKKIPHPMQMVNANAVKDMTTNQTEIEE